MTQAGCKGMSHLYALLGISNSFKLINRLAIKNRLIKRQIWEGKRARDSKININQEALKYHQTKSLNFITFCKIFPAFVQYCSLSTKGRRVIARFL